MNIPLRFEEILKQNQTFYSIVLDVITSFESIFKDNKLYFFEEYTDHGINHIESVLNSCEFIITDESFKNLNPNEVATLILAVILHDLGMHIEYSTFKLLLNGGYDDVRCEIDSKTWKQLWQDYLSEVKRFSSYQKKNIFGDENTKFKIPDLSNKDNLDGIDKKVIGEFIRRNHPRFAHEIALKGLIGNSNIIQFGNEKLDIKNRELAGILARSHGLNIRDCFTYLEKIGSDSWRNPLNINIVYLMVIIRLADYIQIDKNRVNQYLLKVKTFNSPISSVEHKTHLAIESINYNQIDPEKIYVECSPKDSSQFIKINNLIIDIQKEFDTSWAVLGEIYGFIPQNKPSIKFRRISSNLENKNFVENLSFLTKNIGFHVDNNLSRLLVAPLYGDNPTFGVRELLQNAIDSCLERKELEYSKDNFNYVPDIIVSLNRIDDETSIFTIIDNGKGMNEYEIINYFLSVGTSFRKSMDWKRKFIDEEGKSKVNRNGKFGIGVLAAFLLGDEIEVNSMSLTDGSSYSFKTSIDSQSINISKISNLENYGVKITIKINNGKREMLLDQSYKSSSVDWSKWYIYDEPKIKFVIDKIELEKGNKYSIENYYSFKTEYFELIKWNYITEKKHRYSSNNSFQHMLACNGIIINESYANNRFKYENSNYPSNNLIEYKPTIIVDDKDGIFPLKLDRSELDSEDFPFEEDLLIEVSKHYLAKLLTLEINLDKINKNALIHNGYFLYSKKGFLIDSEFFLQGAIDSGFKLARIITNEQTFNFNNFKCEENILTKFILEGSINLTVRRDYLYPEAGGRIVLPTEKFHAHFSNESKRLPLYIKNDIEIEDQNEKYVIYKTKKFDEPFILFDVKNLDKELLNKIQSIQEININHFQEKTHKVTMDIFRRYIKNNFVIPYDISLRKKLYPEAFRELKEFM